jgi:DNA-binding CsgD family transcriptional regulator
MDLEGEPPDRTETSLVRAAMGADATSDLTLDLGLLWQEIMARSTRVSASFCGDERAYLVLAAAQPADARPRPLSGREIELIKRCLLGGLQKSMALDFDLAPSTIAVTLGNALRALGLSGRVSRIPILAFAAAHACYDQTPYRYGRFSQVTWRGRAHAVVSVPRPDQELRDLLAPAEYAVARLLAEGASYAEIAERRRTALRTTANQVASVFHKLGVSGRGALLCSLVRERGRAGRAA